MDKKETKEKEKVTKKIITEKGKAGNKSNKKDIKKEEPFLTGVRKEMGKVRWPLKKEMMKYSIATLSFVIFFVLFFTLADLIIAGVKMLVA